MGSSLRLGACILTSMHLECGACGGHQVVQRFVPHLPAWEASTLIRERGLLPVLPRVPSVSWSTSCCTRVACDCSSGPCTVVNWPQRPGCLAPQRGLATPQAGLPEVPSFWICAPVQACSSNGARAK